LNQDYNIINNPYYSYGGIKTSFKDIKNFILNSNNKDITSEKIDVGNFVFEYIDSKEKLILPLLFKCLIESSTREKIDEFTKLLYNKYSSEKKSINLLLNKLNLFLIFPLNYYLNIIQEYIL